VTIHSHGYVLEKDQAERRETEFQTFSQNLQLLLDKQEEILSCPDYFFTPLSFAGCSWPYIGGGGPLCLGYLLLGWSSELLIEPCPGCKGKALVTFFGGSPLSGCCGWSGFCVDCQSEQSARASAHKPFSMRVALILSLRKTYPEDVSHWEEYDGHIFRWGGSGLTPARKKRLVWTKLNDPVDLDSLITDLNTGQLRPGFAPALPLVPGEITIMLSNKQGDQQIFGIKQAVATRKNKDDTHTL
jgi:hypothetical protein